MRWLPEVLQPVRPLRLEPHHQLELRPQNEMADALVDTRRLSFAAQLEQQRHRPLPVHRQRALSVLAPERRVSVHVVVLAQPRPRREQQRPVLEQEDENPLGERP